MSTLLTIGTLVGLVLGTVHAFGVYARRVRETKMRPAGNAEARLRGLYAALWTVALWTAFGTYVLVLWLISVPFWIGSHARMRSASRAEA